MSRPTEIVINLSALKHNCRLAQSLSAKGKLVAVVKADAYGHGASDIALSIEPEVAMFAVSSLEEAVLLRNHGIQKPVLLLEGCFTDDEYIKVAEQGFEIVVHNQTQLDQLVNLTITPSITVWLKIDSGMHRLGISCEDTQEFIEQLQGADSVKNLILMTHLASADILDFDYTQMQLERFWRSVDGLDLAKFDISIANSAGILAWDQSRANWNRPGIMLYGLSPFDHPHDEADKLKPVMSFESEVIAVRHVTKGEAVGYGSTWVADKDSVIATVAVGYGDGYPRTAASGTPVLVNGERAKLAGRVSMDMITVDVSALDSIKVGDRVELWGTSLCANEVASWSGTIGYELVTRMPKRTRRLYIE